MARPFVLLLAMTAAAHADAKAAREFEAGVDAFRLGKHADARAHLEAAVALDPQLPGPHRFLAAVAQAEGRFADCIAEARIALELNPRSAELADTRKLHDACRASAGRAAFRGELGDGAAIAVTTSVPGATVTIDHLAYGGTPLAPRAITPGTHVVEVAKAGYQAAHASVHALPGIVTDVALDLVEDSSVAARIAPAEVATTVTIREGDEVLVDGERVSARVGTPVAIAPGEHVVEVRRAGAEAWRRRVRLTAGEQRALTPMFEPARASMRHRGKVLVLVGTGFGAVALVSGGVAVVTDNATRWGFLVSTGVSALAATACWSWGLVNIVRGRPVPDAVPPLAVVPIEGGAMANTGFAW